MPGATAMKALVVVPTYNERGNVTRLLPVLLEQDADLHVLVVDDSSPDGTGAAVEAMAASEPRIHVLHREEKLGLGTAYVEGFRWALEHTDASCVFEMDADFSHDPGAIPQFLRSVDDADLVIGSRYLNGINVINWPLRRLMISVFANHYASFITGIPVRDLTSGFKCFRRSTLEALPLDSVHSDGYGFQIELTWHAWRRGFRVVEIPIVFTDRVDGDSKLSGRIVWEAIWLVWRLRIRGGR